MMGLGDIGSWIERSAERPESIDEVCKSLMGLKKPNAQLCAGSTTHTAEGHACLKLYGDYATELHPSSSEVRGIGMQG